MRKLQKMKKMISSIQIHGYIFHSTNVFKAVYEFGKKKLVKDNRSINSEKDESCLIYMLL